MESKQKERKPKTNTKPKEKVEAEAETKQKKEGLTSTQTFMLYAGILLASRSASVLYSVSTDCDETMNFYEPTHYLLHGKGLQTWEYSPHYALRSWFYLLIHAVGAKIASFLVNPELAISAKLIEFYGIRLEIAVLSSLSEAYLLLQIRRLCGSITALLGLCFLFFAPGMYAAGTAFLPSSFAMISLTAAYAGLLAGREFIPILLACVAVLVAWPFVGLAAIPLGLGLVFKQGVKSLPKHIFTLIFKGILSLIIVVVPLVLVDSYFYGRTVLAPWQIVLYNVINQPEGGSALYGVEPWHFYILNGILNFNGAFVLALLSAPLVSLMFIVAKKYNKKSKYLFNGAFWATMSAFYLWVGFMSLQAHKEERFIFVVYPIICVLAAVSLYLVGTVIGKLFRPLKYMIFTCALALFVTISVSRIYAVQSGFSASQDSWYYLSEVELAGEKKSDGLLNVCVGKEWYRYPSAFFLPTDKAEVKFIVSNFTGELPQPFGEHPWDEPLQPFNDLNKMEPSRYIDVDECHYIIDQEFEGQAEPMYSKFHDKWEIIWSKNFLDAPKSPALTRSFYIPNVSPKTNVYSKYLILKNKNMSN